MAYETVRYNRRELYEQAWSEPMTKLAKRYGISDVGLRKVCAKLKVPVPERGYWAKVRTGWCGNHPELPGTNGPEELVVERWKRTCIDSMSSEVQSKIAQRNPRPNMSLWPRPWPRFTHWLSGRSTV